MRYAIIFDGVVLNIALADSALGADWVLIPEDVSVGIGWLYVDGEFLAGGG